MANDLVAFEEQLAPLAPRFHDVLPNTLPVDRFTRTAMVCVERNPKLLQCNRQSLFNAIMTFAVLGLEIDGVTGQGFILPFKDRAQPCIGYKGMNTLAARSGLTITGEVVREGDEFDYMLGTNAFVHHKPKLGNKGRIIAAWAQADAHGRPPVIAILSIDELMAIKAKSPGAKKPDSPWNDPDIGFPAMCAKSAKRRLARSTPLNVMQLAARMEEAFEEQGRTSFISPNRELVIEGEIESPIAPAEKNETPTMEELVAKPSPKPEDRLESLKADGRAAAALGMVELRRWWGIMQKEDIEAKSRFTHLLFPYLETDLKPMARKADERGFEETPATPPQPPADGPGTSMASDTAEPETNAHDPVLDDLQGYQDALSAVPDIAALEKLDGDVRGFLKEADRADLLPIWNTDKLLRERILRGMKTKG